MLSVSRMRMLLVISCCEKQVYFQLELLLYISATSRCDIRYTGTRLRYRSGPHRLLQAPPLPVKGPFELTDNLRAFEPMWLSLIELNTEAGGNSGDGFCFTWLAVSALFFLSIT